MKNITNNKKHFSMRIQIKGTFLKSTKQTGTSAKGNQWEKYEVIIVDTENKELQVTLFGDKFAFVSKLETGTEVDIVAFLESKEYNGRYFTNISGVELKTVNEENKKEAEAVAGGAKMDEQFEKSLVEDDLPF